MEATPDEGDGRASGAGAEAPADASSPARSARPGGHRQGGPGRWRDGGRSWKAILFAPVGDGQVRRRGSDGLRLGAAVVAVLVCWAVTRANSKAEHSVATTLASAPQGIHWLVSVIWWVGSFGVIVAVAALALFARKWPAVRDMALSGVAAWVVSEVLIQLWGTTGGRPVTPSLRFFDLAFPVARVAATVAVATAALPYLSRWLQLTIETALGLLAVSAVAEASGLPASVLASLALGWGITALVHLVFGSPLGLPSDREVRRLLNDLDLDAESITPKSRQEWGVGRFEGRIDAADVDVSVYGRDASDAQLLAKTARFLFYRDSGPTLTFTRRQQVEHEAYLMLMAERAGVNVPAVLAAGPAGPARDAMLVTRPPPGARLSGYAAYAVPPSVSDDDDDALQAPAAAPVPGREAPELADAGLDDVFAQLMVLRSAGIAHGSLSTETIVVNEEGAAGFLDFRTASTVATTEQLNRDMAAALAAVSVVAGPERTVASALRSVPKDVTIGALPFLQRAALDPVASKTLRGKKSILTALREQGAAAVGVDVPKLIEPRRVSWVNIVLVLGTLVGGWALIGVLINVTKSWSTIAGAKWGWVAVVFLLAQAAYPAIAITTVGSVTDPLPFGRTLALELSDTFVGLAGGSMAVLATRVRFFQQEGYSPTVAVSSGVLVSTASWIVKGGLFLIALPFALGQLHFHDTSSDAGGGKSHLVWLIVIIVVAVGVGLGLVFAVPRWRRLAAEKLRPKASEVWAHLKLLATHPRNLVEIFGGNVAAQLLVALALGASLHAFGDHLDLATLVVVLTLGSMVGGVSPVPGGMGVVEAGMILGLTAAGINESDAVAAVFVQRLFTAYLPPIWGWFVLVWMRKKEYL